jgi:hypothetical protein
MRAAVLALILLVSGLDAFAKGHSSGARAGHGSTATAASKRTGGGSGGTASSHLRLKAPPLAPDRKVHQQDCTKPIDWSSGNISCK